MAGALSMWDMAALLAPAGRANLAAAAVALPAPPLPPDPHAAASSADARSGIVLLPCCLTPGSTHTIWRA